MGLQTGLFENQSTSLEKLDAAYEGEDPLVKRLQHVINWKAALLAHILSAYHLRLKIVDFK